MARFPSASPEVIKHTAPLLFGSLTNWGLYGVLTVQTYVYSYNFPDDKRSIKVLTYGVFLLETVQTILTAADAYYWFIAGFGVVERLQQSHFAPIDIPLVHAVISLIVQEYFCYRIWTLSRRPWLCGLIAILAIVESIGALWGGIESLVVGRYAVSKAALILWSILSALVDILIAGSMVLLLTRPSSRGSSFPNHVLVRVVRLVVETNTLTASVAVASFALYVAFPNEIYYTFTAGIIGKLYSNTLLVSLNNRIYFRDSPISITVGDNEAISSDHSRRFVVSSPFSPDQPSTNTVTNPTGEGFKLHSISHPIHIGQGKADEASFSSGQSH